MLEKDFCAWFLGFMELNHEPPNEQQWECIKEHLRLTLKLEEYKTNKLSEETKKQIGTSVLNQEEVETLLRAVKGDPEPKESVIPPSFIEKIVHTHDVPPTTPPPLTMPKHPDNDIDIYNIPMDC